MHLQEQQQHKPKKRPELKNTPSAFAIVSSRLPVNSRLHRAGGGEAAEGQAGGMTVHKQLQPCTDTVSLLQIIIKQTNTHPIVTNKVC